MTLSQITSQVQQPDQERVDQAMEWLMRLPQLPRDTLPPMGDIERVIDRLSQPVDPAWCMARVAALLSPYYDRDTPQGVREIDAEDWMAELKPYPRWAIERAARWWKSADNPKRRQKPVEGDIAARCKLEMRGIGSLPVLLARKSDNAPEPPRQPVTQADRDRRKEEAERILADVGFRVRRVPAHDE